MRTLTALLLLLALGAGCEMAPPPPLGIANPAARAEAPAIPFRVTLVSLTSAKEGPLAGKLVAELAPPPGVEGSPVTIGELEADAEGQFALPWAPVWRALLRRSALRIQLHDAGQRIHRWPAIEVRRAGDAVELVVISARPTAPSETGDPAWVHDLLAGQRWVRALADDKKSFYFVELRVFSEAEASDHRNIDPMNLDK